MSERQCPICLGWKNVQGEGCVDCRGALSFELRNFLAHLRVDKSCWIFDHCGHWAKWTYKTEIVKREYEEEDE